MEWWKIGKEADISNFPGLSEELKLCICTASHRFPYYTTEFYVRKGEHGDIGIHIARDGSREVFVYSGYFMKFSNKIVPGTNVI